MAQFLLTEILGLPTLGLIISDISQSVSEGVSCGRAILLSVVSRGSSLMLLRENCGGLICSLTIYFNLYMVLIMSGIVKIRA